MKIPVAIVLGAALIAGAIMFVGRYEVDSDGPTPVRLDRWTGGVTLCVHPPNDFGTLVCGK